MSDCKFCHNPIGEWKKEGGKNVPYNPDGSPHKCKDGVMIKTAVPVNKAPAEVGLLVSYNETLATFLTEDGKQHHYALTRDVFQDWQKAGHNLPPEHHPDVWLAFRLDAAKFVQKGATVTQRPEWADKTRKDPPKEEVEKPFSTGREILQQNLDQKRASQGTPTDAPGASAPSNNPTEPGKPAGTAPVPAQNNSDADLESRVQQAIAGLLPSDRVGYRISLAGMVNSVIEMKKMSTDAPKTYAELEAEVKRNAIRLFLWCDRLTTHNLKVE